jgi:Xaa-Pro aminopeptidase
VDALLVTDVVNVRYLTGFTGSNAAVLVQRDGATVFATDGRYLTQASEEVPDVETVDSRAVATALAQRASAAGVSRLGVEAAHVTLSLHRQLAAAAGSTRLVATNAVVERQRTVKDETELALLAEACRITDAAFADILGQLVPGTTEREVEWNLATSMRHHGAEALAFDSIVAFGSNSAIPHHQPTPRPLERGDLVKLDFGARYAGYHADMTRTVALRPVADWQREIHAVVETVQRECREAALPGAGAGDIDSLARQRLHEVGHVMPHGLGHGVGLEVHELPFLSPEPTTAMLVDRVPVTVEPGVYLPGRGGVRIEDTTVVTAGGAESLTRSPRGLIEL